MANSNSDVQVIADGKVVQLNYVLTSTAGEVLDRADGQDPFVYLHGADQIVPGLESALAGLRAGDKKKVNVGPAEGYGEKNSELVMKVKRAQFPKDVEIEVGMQFEANSPEGDMLVFTVTALEGEFVEVDGNHPLAGVTLNFDVEVVGVRDATEEERSHGHAHGPDGHHHH